MEPTEVLAIVGGHVNDELLLRNEYVALENRILRSKFPGRVPLNDDEPGKHRMINDGASGATDLWSAQKIGGDLGGKSDAAHHHDAAYVNTGEALSIGSAMLVDGAALAEIIDDDGAASGLDADLLDGEEGAFYRNASNLNAGTLYDKLTGAIPGA